MAQSVRNKNQSLVYFRPERVVYFPRNIQKRFSTSNYACILESNAKKLIDYINSNINKYVESTYLKLENNKNEEKKALLKLLNHDDIELDNKIKILNFTDTIIDDISQVSSVSQLFEIILENNKMEPSWDNVNLIFTENGKHFTEDLIKYLNNIEVASSLSSKNYSEVENDTFKKSFFELNEIDDELYIKYIKAFLKPILDVEIENLQEEKVKGLVIEKKLVFTSHNYSNIRERFPPLQIDFAVNNIHKFIDIFPDLDITEAELILLLKKVGLGDDIKFEIIEAYTDNYEVNDIELVSLIGKLYLEYPQQELSEEIISKILLFSTLDEEDKIGIFMRNNTLYNDSVITDFLIALGGKFKGLTEKGPMPTFDRSETLDEFFEYLRSQDYVSKVIPQKGNRVKVTTFKV